MPPKHLRNHQQQAALSEEEEGATGGEPAPTLVSTTSSPEATFNNLAKMFETYMQSQMEKERKQDKERE